MRLFINMKLPKSLGFSLVELMVVIAIIGIVSAIAIGSIGAIQKNSRDTQRIADLSNLRSALQQFYADRHYYPDSLTLTGGAALTNCSGVAGCTTVTRTYLKNTPVDPVTGTTTPYRYCSQRSSTNTADCATSSNGQCHYYALCATLENPGTTATCSCAAPATGNYQVNPL